MSAPWLTIIGVSEAGVDALGDAALALLTKAKTVFGAERFTRQLRENRHQSVRVWTSPFSVMIEEIIATRGTQTIVLASGDPNWFGAGATLARYLEPHEYDILPAPSSFQLAATLMRWPMAEVQTVSFHARSVDNLYRELFPGARILALTSDRQTLIQVAKRLVGAGYGASNLSVLENLGSKDQKQITFLAHQAHLQDIGDFYVLAIECVAEESAQLMSLVPGLPDELFEHDGQLTKREVRAVTLSSLAPFPGALLWDVGAGSGAIGIEWMRAAPLGKAICFERDARRCERIELNRTALGAPGLNIINAEASLKLRDHPAPDAIFIGGDVANETLFKACWKSLKPGGRLVANAVTIESISALVSRQKMFGGTLISIGISTIKSIGSSHVLHPTLPITQWAVIKPKPGGRQ